MIISALGVVAILFGLIAGDNGLRHWIPFHISAGGALVSGIIMILICLVYFYFSYQLLLGSQSVRKFEFFDSDTLDAVILKILNSLHKKRL
jgi:hypothetical protein